MSWVYTALIMVAAALASPVRVGPGVYRPLYPPSPAEAEIQVDPFLLDATPVTNADFLGFVLSHPEWRRDQAAALFRDDAYLSHWAGAVTLGSAVDGRQPVTRVSWFAARAYCEAQGARLPLEAEWELAAMASESQADASHDPAFLAKILAWYGTPNDGPLAAVGQGPANVWGVYDLHGLVWEWIEDYNSALINVDNRQNGGTDKTAFCGAAAYSAKDKEDYAAFMRVAFRSSLEGRYTARNLGFRCARDLGGTP